MDTSKLNRRKVVAGGMVVAIAGVAGYFIFQAIRDLLFPPGYIPITEVAPEIVATAGQSYQVVFSSPEIVDHELTVTEATTSLIKMGVSEPVAPAVIFPLPGIAPNLKQGTVTINQPLQSGQVLVVRLRFEDTTGRVKVDNRCTWVIAVR